jgi:tetratricopeptide (TPR) repeat protein
MQPMTEDSAQSVSPEVKPPIVLSPWLVLAAALVLYGLTLNHWITFGSIPLAAQLMGWDWHPGSLPWRPDHQYHPLFIVLTAPLRLLPASERILGLNLFSAICASLTLAILARSVRLFAQNRTKEQRVRERAPFGLLSIRAAFLPVAFAVVLLAGQLTFWENAVVASGEMLDLLVFAFLILCLLEFRVSQNDQWLNALAFVYGLGMANNWALIGFFPFFFIGLIWIKRIAFLNSRFLLRMILCGCAGLLLYGLTPLLGSLAHDGDFWEILRQNLTEQHISLLRIPKFYVLMAAVPSLIPLLFAAINWPTFRGNGDLSAMAMNSSKAFFRILHIALLAVGILMFFDLKYSLSPRKMGIGTILGVPTFLTFYYLAALSVGYFTGYVLLVFGQESKSLWHRTVGSMHAINFFVTVGMWIAALGLPVLLFHDNSPVLRDYNRPVAAQFGAELVKNLPAQPAIVLSDDPNTLYLAMNACQSLSSTNQYAFIESHDLFHGDYLRYLVGHYPILHKEILNPEFPAEFSSDQISGLLANLTQRVQVYYLHPSFGSFFERLYMVPHGLGGIVRSYQTNALAMPVLSAEHLATNQAYWHALEKGSLATLPDLGKNNPDARRVADNYSQILDNWGVELQKAIGAYPTRSASLLNDANDQFAQALLLNPNNVVARANQQYNAHLRGVAPKGTQVPDLASLFYNRWDAALIFNGPADVPDLDIQIGCYFADRGAGFQAARLFQRCLDLNPNNPTAELDLAKAYIELGQVDAAFTLVKDVQQRSTGNPLELVRVEALAYAAKKDFAQADKLLTEEHNRNPKDEMFDAAMTEIYRVMGFSILQKAGGTPALEKNADKEAAVWFKKALASIDNQIQLVTARTTSEQEVSALNLNKAKIQMSMKDFEAAISTLNAMAHLDSVKPVSLLHRAISELQINRLDAAKKDYLDVEKMTPSPSQVVYYGLVQVAQKQNDKPTGIHYAKLFLKYTSPTSPDFASISQQLHKWQSE